MKIKLVILLSRSKSGLEIFAATNFDLTDKWKYFTGLTSKNRIAKIPARARKIGRKIEVQVERKGSKNFSRYLFFKGRFKSNPTILPLNNKCPQDKKPVNVKVVALRL